jgi:hypothetical protein
MYAVDAPTKDSCDLVWLPVHRLEPLVFPRLAN